MLRMVTLATLWMASLGLLSPSQTNGKEVRGFYLETRTCQVYTGPCFANAEVGLAGHDAIMAWKIETGQYQGVDLSGLSVVVVLNASDTLGFKGIDSAQTVRSVILVDDQADQSQREALIEFAKYHSGKAGESVMRIDSAPIEMALDTASLLGNLDAGKTVKLRTRAARRGDCICSNESAYYPPLAKVDNFAPGVTMEGRFSGRGLGSRWSTPGDRSAYMATFAYLASSIGRTVKPATGRSAHPTSINNPSEP